MVSKTWKAILVAAATGSMALMASAQAPRGEPVKEGERAGPSSSLSSMSVDQHRMFAIMRMGLNDPALRLNTAQKAEISKLLDNYAFEQRKQDVLHPVARGERLSSTAAIDRQAKLANLDTAVVRVLSEEQRRTREASKAARREALELAARNGPPRNAPIKK